MEEFPPLVRRAHALASQIGFPLTTEDAGPANGPTASLPGVGRFLAMLAAGCAGGRIGELGTGAGIGAAWIASAMPADCTLITAEIDEHRAAAARQLFSDDPRVEVISGDARAVMSGRGPYDLLFSDGGGGQDPALIDWLRIGGRIVMDDVTPGRPVAGDPKRKFFFGDSRLVSAEVVLPDLRNALLVGTRAS
jgi:predicted O-methyltransferase YrrM